MDPLNCELWILHLERGEGKDERDETEDDHCDDAAPAAEEDGPALGKVRSRPPPAGAFFIEGADGDDRGGGGQGPRLLLLCHCGEI